MDCGLSGSSVHGISQPAGVSCHFFLQGIFLTQGLNLSLWHWKVDSLPLGPQDAIPNSLFIGTSRVQGWSYDALWRAISWARAGSGIQLMPFYGWHSLDQRPELEHICNWVWKNRQNARVSCGLMGMKFSRALWRTSHHKVLIPWWLGVKMTWYCFNQFVTN